MSDRASSGNADQIVYWNEVAGAKWVANQARLDRVFKPLTAALIAAAALRPGEHVLDVGCGCGETSLLAASRVGASGQVAAIDLSRPMLDHAASRPVAADMAPVAWVQADAMIHSFAPTFDLLMSRFGIMFFSDQVAALGNLRRALKVGGRFAFIAWQERAAVEWMQWPLDQVAAILPAGAATTGEPGPFGCADATATLRVLAEAGFAAVAATPVNADLVIGAGADPVEDAMTLLFDAGPVATLFREAEPAQGARAKVLLRDGLAVLAKGDTITLKGACWLYQGIA